MDGLHRERVPSTNAILSAGRELLNEGLGNLDADIRCGAC